MSSNKITGRKIFHIPLHDSVAANANVVVGISGASIDGPLLRFVRVNASIARDTGFELAVSITEGTIIESLSVTWFAFPNDSSGNFNQNSNFQYFVCHLVPR